MLGLLSLDAEADAGEGPGAECLLLTELGLGCWRTGMEAAHLGAANPGACAEDTTHSHIQYVLL